MVIFRKADGTEIELKRTDLSSGSKLRRKPYRKTTQDGYTRILLEKDDPYYTMADKSGYVLQHRYIMAQHLGRVLTLDEVVHHKNKNKKDNRIENLEILSKGTHYKYHRMEWKIKSLEASLNQVQQGYTKDKMWE